VRKWLGGQAGVGDFSLHYLHVLSSGGSSEGVGE
jgi:hypothetical protein